MATSQSETTIPEQEIEIITGPKYGSLENPTELGKILLETIGKNRWSRVKVSVHPTPRHRLNFETLLTHCSELIRQGKDVIFHAVEEEIEWLMKQPESQREKSLHALHEGLKLLPSAFYFNRCHCPRVGKARFIFLGPLPSGLNDERDKLKWKIQGMIDSLVCSNYYDFGHYSLARHMGGWDTNPLTYFDESGIMLNQMGEEKIIRGLNLCLQILVLTHQKPNHAIGTNDPIKVRAFDPVGYNGAIAYSQYLRSDSELKKSEFSA